MFWYVGVGRFFHIRVFSTMMFNGARDTKFIIVQVVNPLAITPESPNKRIYVQKLS